MKKISWLSFILSCFPLASGAIGVNLDEPKTIKAKKIVYSLKTEEIKTSGGTEITNKSGQKVTLTDSYITQKGASLQGNDIKLWLGQNVYIESDDIVREKDLTIAKNAIFTACYGCDSFGNAWELSGTKAVHNMSEHMMQIFNPVLYVYNVPVFWMPYLEMPDPSIKYKTGFLMPDLESTNNMGTQINIPFYVSISDHHDLTATFSYITKENPLFKLEHRLNAEHSSYRTSGSFTRNKDGENRWHIFNDDVIDLGEYARATIFLARASDNTYLQKYGFYEDQPYLDSGAKLELFGQSGYVIADAHIFQELRTGSSYRSVPSGNILPNIRGNYQTNPFFHETYATFDADILGISGSGTASQRIMGDARIVSPWTLWGGNRVTASVSTRYDVYNFYNTQLIDGQEFSGLKNRFLPSGYLEWALPLVKISDSWTQIIEPKARLTATYNTDDDQYAMNNDSAGAFLSDTTLFSDNRFSGLDLWEKSTYADYGVKWSAFNNKTGQSFGMFLGQSYDFINRDIIDETSGFHDGPSDYVGRIEYRSPKWIDFYNRFRVSQDTFDLQHMETSISLRKSGNYLLFGHMWSRNYLNNGPSAEPINEIIAGTGVKLSNRWSLRFNATYNLTDDRFQRHSGGLFYNHPCYYMSFEYRRDNATKGDYVGTTTFQFKVGMALDGQKR